MSLTFGSWCSGIEAASEAWLPLGWSCAYVAEIEPFPCAYLAQRHGAGRPRYMPAPEDAPNAKEALRRRAAIKSLGRIAWGARIPNLGDISQVSAAELPPVDILGAGFPCQGFSIAGLRGSLSDHRGNLSVIGVRLLLEAAELGLVRGAVLEQVPDVLNTSDNAWGNILGALVGADAALEGLEHGGKWPCAGMVAGPRSRVAWRILDAQHFSLAQRRERVWAVVDFGDGPDPAAVLFERKGLSGHPAPRAEPRERTPHAAAGSAALGGWDAGRPQWRPAVEVAPTLLAQGNRTGGDRPPGTTVDTCETLIPVAYPVAHSLRVEAFGGNRTGGGIDVHTALSACHTASGRQDFETETFLVEADPIAFNARQDPISGPVVGPVVGPVDTDGSTHAIAIRTSQTGANGANISVGLGYPVSANESPQAIAFGITRDAIDRTGEGSGGNRSNPQPGDPCHPLPAQGRPPTLASAMAVRRITPTEAERLQGFADGATLIHWPSKQRRGDDLAETLAYLRAHGFSEAEAVELAKTPDGPRYKALGNSWPTKVARWIGERITADMEPS